MEIMEWLLEEIKKREESLTVLNKLLKIDRLREKKAFYLDCLYDKQKQLKDLDDPESEVSKACPIPIHKLKISVAKTILNYTNKIKEFESLMME